MQSKRPGGIDREMPGRTTTGAAVRGMQNRSFVLLKAEARRLNAITAATSHQGVEDALSSPVARIFGLSKKTLMNSAAFDEWVRHVRREGINATIAVLTLLDVQAPLTQQLLDDLLITKTSFFRHRQQYEIACSVFTQIFAAREASRNLEPVKIWVPGCSNGSEVYTIAMILKKTGHDRKGIPIEITGTDLSQEQITQAKAGGYDRLDEREDQQMETGTAGLIESHQEFLEANRAEGGCQVRQDVIAMTRFELDNLLFTSVRGTFDVISCHHVLEHLSGEGQQQVADVLANRLAVGGIILSNDNFIEGKSGLRMLSLPVAGGRYVAYSKV